MSNRCFVVARCPAILAADSIRLNVIDNGDGTVSLYVLDELGPTYPANVTAAGSPVVGASPGGSVSGSGTTGKLTKWTNGAGSVLGDSIITEAGATISIGGALLVPSLNANSFLYSGVGGQLTTPTAPTNGQLLIGSTGAAPVVATLTGGAGITITNAAGSITIAATGGISGLTTGTIPQAASATNLSDSVITQAANMVGVGLGTVAPPTNFTVGDTSATTPRGVMSWQASNDTGSAHLHLRKTRGTFAVPLTVAVNDLLGRAVYSGFDGASYLESSSIRVTVVGTVAATRIPTKMEFLTATDAAPSVPTVALTLAQDQTATFARAVTISSGNLNFGASSAANPSFIPGSLVIAAKSTDGTAFVRLQLGEFEAGYSAASNIGGGITDAAHTTYRIVFDKSDTAMIQLASNGVYAFGSTTSGNQRTEASDTGISRISAGLAGVGTGASGSFAGSLKLTNVTAVGLTANAFLYSGTGSLLTSTGAPTNGQLLIGSTGVAPVAAALTAGANITITNAGGSITIAATGGGVTGTGTTGQLLQWTNGGSGVAGDSGFQVTTGPLLTVDTTQIGRGGNNTLASFRFTGLNDNQCGLYQNSSGATILNSASGQTIRLAENNGVWATLNTASGIVLSAAVPLAFSSGTNQRAGNATLVGGTVTVSNATVTANTVVMLTRKTSGGTIGTAITYTLSAGASFTITSDNILDTSTFSYVLIEVP